MPSEHSLSSNGEGGTEIPPQAAINPGDQSLDAALSLQRNDWLRGIRIPIAERLKASGALSADPIKAAELIYHESVLRRESGEPPDWDRLLEQFPEYAAQLRLFHQADEIVDGAIAPSDRSSTQLGGFELLDEVGCGGMGIVYRARERSLDRIVAVKVIRGGALADDISIKRFLNEAKAISRLNHPNIVHIYCVGECEGEPFISFEFVNGPNLGERIGGTPLPPRLAASIVADVACAIQHAHQQSILHRDLKPANVLLSGPPDEPVPKVTDFGAAKELNQSGDREVTRFLGTPSYMAPEQVELKWGPIGKRTDVYGVGAVLYEALTGRPPFRADSIGETLRQVVEREPVGPRWLNPATPRDLDTIAMKCLSKDPGRRYAAAEDVADDLNRFLRGEPIHARPVSPGGRAIKWFRRNPVMSGLSAILILALVGGISGIVYQWRQAESARGIAVASEKETEQLLSELISPYVQNLKLDAQSAEPLLNAESRCRRLLEKHPGDLDLRMALTRVYFRLGSYLVQNAESEKAEDAYRSSRALWEPLVGDSRLSPAHWDWLAVTCWTQAGFEELRLDRAKALRHCQEAEALWEELIDERSTNVDLMHKLIGVRWHMRRLLQSSGDSGDCLRLLVDSQHQLAERVRAEPANRPLRRRLALNCFLLGEAYGHDSSTASAKSFWQQAYQHYRMLVDAKHGDTATTLALALCCARLAGMQRSDPYYVEAVPLFEQVGAHFDSLLKVDSAVDVVWREILESYCTLILCHSKVGRSDASKRILEDNVLPMTQFALDKGVDSALALSLANFLSNAAAQLRDANDKADALLIARQAKALIATNANWPSRDPRFLRSLGGSAILASGLLNQLGDPSAALEQAELALHAFEKLRRAAPHEPDHESLLHDAWQRIGKARWDLGRRNEALAAFRESTSLEKVLFERHPSNRVSRVALSKCYDRLLHFASQAGDFATAAGALMEREKLWTDNREKLIEVSDDYVELARKVVMGKDVLSAKEKGERDHFLAEGKRVRQAAAAIGQRNGSSNAVTIIAN